MNAISTRPVASFRHYRDSRPTKRANPHFAAKRRSPVAGRRSPALLAQKIRLVEDNGNLDNAILNYLFAKDFANRIRRQMDVRSLQVQGKRSYWKQCAFNAVSCFG
ncbi:hypothetical protein V9T40_008235 [Parthenolecanium corni]|uniref:Prohormone-1 n=1 Tax=Parthenolecanium corni TaxID=536013 RepID=A0AAN9TY39_9HEMI